MRLPHHQPHHRRTVNLWFSYCHFDIKYSQKSGTVQCKQTLCQVNTREVMEGRKSTKLGRLRFKFPIYMTTWEKCFFMTHSVTKSLLSLFFLPSSWLLNHHLNPLTQDPGCKKAPRGSQAWLEHLNMKWTLLGMETARHCESHADPQERGPPINGSGDGEFSLSLSLFLSGSLSLFFKLS